MPEQPCLYYDAHAHLVADDQARYPRNPPPKSETPTTIPPGVAGTPGGHSGPNPLKVSPDASRMLQWMREERVCGMAAVQKSMVYQFDNSYIIDSGAEHANMDAVIAIDPTNPETPDLIRKAAARGTVGVRFFGKRGERTPAWLSSEGAHAVWRTAEELGLVVDVEAPARGADELIPTLADMAGRYPGVQVALDHLFMPDVTAENFGMNENYGVLVARPSVNFKFTTINLDTNREFNAPSERVLRRAVDVIGADRIMWGSDVGTSAGTYHDMLARALEATALLTDAERKGVMHDTGARVFGKR